MFKMPFSAGLTIAGIVLGIVLVVLDKASKLKGSVLLALLGVAAVMTLPLALGNSWVSDAPSGTLKWSRGMLLISVVGVIYSAVAVWISTGAPTKNLPEESYSPPNETAQDRHLTLEQANYLVASINDFRSQAVVVNFVLGDTESQVFAQELTQVLENAHWDVRRVVGLPLTFRGIRITPQDPTDVPQAAEALIRAFSDHNIPITRDYVQPTSFEYNGNNYVPTLYLFVGKNGEPTPIPPKYALPLVIPTAPNLPSDLRNASSTDLGKYAEQMANALRDYEAQNRRRFEAEWHIHGTPLRDDSYRGLFERFLRPSVTALRD